MSDFGSRPPEQQLDFWLGEWDVSWHEGGHGTNSIRRVLGGKVVQEDFDGTPAIDLRGRSVSVYREKLGEWHQTWVDNQGNYWHLQGGWRDDRFVLITDDRIEGNAVKFRMVFHDIEPDSLSWDWELSRDGGASWELRWRIHYERRLADG